MVFTGEQKVNRSKIGEGIYLLYFAIMVGVRACGFYDGQTVYNVALVAGMGLFVAKMLVTKHSVKEYGVAIALLLLAVIVYLRTGEKGLFVCFTMMLGMKEVSVRKAIKVGAIVAGVIIMVKIFLGVFGFVPEIYYPQERAGIGLMFRHALGYAHPNTLHMNVLMLSMMVTYLVTDWLRGCARRFAVVTLAGVSLLVFAFNYYIFQYSGSRTGILACIVYLGVNFWFFCRSKMGISEKIVGYAAFPGASFIAIVLPFLLKGELFDLVNMRIFTTRFSIARYFWSHNSVSLFGIRLNNPDVGFATYGLDMAQLYLFLQLGIVAFVLIAVLDFFFVKKCFELDLRGELAVFIGMIFLGIWEPLLYNLGFKNFTYVFMGAVMYAALSGNEEYVKLAETSSAEESDDGRVAAFDVKKAVGILVASVIVGIAVSMIYLAVTVKPTALYGDRQEGENGQPFGMEEMYFSEDQISEFEAAGDLVVGYVDESVPMYRYDQSIALMEYEKKVISIGVFGGIFAIILMIGVFYSRFIIGSMNDKHR